MHLTACVYSRKKLLNPTLSAALRAVAPGTACRLVPTELRVHILFRFPYPVQHGRYTLKTEHHYYFRFFLRGFTLSLRFGQAFGLLVSVSYTHYCASTSDLSTT